ncbi:cell wall-binding repeat-containing protein [Clostridium sp. WLY-B-L2]|uniref:Cell wall-binding repeat-containing protein n=1 Tax=Clostridium aromativorans TaxID=2836848 RepID=A0ABS8NAH3_9CLOT|nr:MULTISPECIES: cell wall-binding repeat-containing protein [Clostridium]KAA8666932.1 cell wall-binding repeat-containing protein [Clostridium sp. HV4-5-A1G]MCC9296809.1 cell wall-binding repeat-containing protein [Clostridium aromativorans]
MKSKKLMSIVVAAAVCVSFLGTAKFAGNNVAKANTQTTQTVQASNSSNVIRLGGTDRYDTSVKISQYGWRQADTVFIAGAEHDADFADAIAGTPLAHSYDAPILLTRAAALPDNISEEITRLSPKNVYILGGTGVVSSNIENGLKAKGYTVTRIAGKDRYETAIEIAKQLWAKYPSSNTGAILTTGQQFQYALSIAASADAPILFSDGNTINSKVANLIASNKNIRSIEVVGGDKVVHLGDYYKNNPSLFLIDNYNSVSELEKGTKLENVHGIAVASDTIFPDALSGSALAAKLGYVLVLSNGTDFSYTIEPLENVLSSAIFLGGTGVISDGLPGKISAIFNKDIPSNPDGLKDSDEVPFTDENLKKDVEKALGKTNVTLADAKKVLNLTLNDNNDLIDLKYFPNLMVLTMNGGSISNVDYMTNLHNLEYLHLNNCKYDLDSLKSLKNTTVIADGQIISRTN